MSKVKINITVNEENLEKVDTLRGLVNRSAFIDDIISKSLLKKGVKK